MAGFPVRLDGPSNVALFAYDNNTFIVQNFRHTETDVRIGVAGGFTKLRNLVTDEVLAPPGTGRRIRTGPSRGCRATSLFQYPSAAA